jgi:sugar phosphate isomerase/epimerase
MLAFSTCWNNARHTEGDAMIAEILELGFSNIELSHGMTITKLPGIKRSFARGEFVCAGVHNYFPSPVEVMIDAPDAYEFTSHRPFERQRALEMTRRTLDLAAEFGARYVVLHMGSVPLDPAKWTRRLTAMVRDGRQLDPKFTAAKVEFVRRREKLSPLYLHRAISALEEIAEHAKAVGVPVAVESRSRYEDVPSEREMVALQEHFKDNRWVGYWHDFGHVQLKHNLGLLDHGSWLGGMAAYLLGGHLHDVEWPDRDHRVPFTGTLDYAPLLANFAVDAPVVWELSPSRKEEEIRAALQVWNQMFPERAAGRHLRRAD